MATTKRNEFNKKVLEISEFAKALSHPARIMILDVLSNYKDQTCKEIVAELPLSQPTVSQHLKKLVEAGLICLKQDGAKSLYCIEWNQLSRLFSSFDRLSQKLMPNRPKRNCC